MKPLFVVQVVEPFTAHYVFALGVARFLSCAHWILQVRPPPLYSVRAMYSTGLCTPAYLDAELEAPALSFPAVQYVPYCTVCAQLR